MNWKYERTSTIKKKKKKNPLLKGLLTLCFHLALESNSVNRQIAFEMVLAALFTPLFLFYIRLICFYLSLFCACLICCSHFIFCAQSNPVSIRIAHSHGTRLHRLKLCAAWVVWVITPALGCWADLCCFSPSFLSLLWSEIPTLLMCSLI